MKHKIFIAEDDQGILDVMKMMLEIQGFEATTASDGPVLTLIENSPPDLLLLDILMPGMDGETIFKHLKSQKKPNLYQSLWCRQKKTLRKLRLI